MKMVCISENLVTHISIKAPIPSVNAKISTGLRDKGVRIIIEQEDPNSPLHSAKSFEELNL